MPRHRIPAGVLIGFVTWAATAGVLVGFGLGHGDAAGAFVGFGTAILAGAGTPRPPLPIAIVTGLTAHAVWMAAWGICFFAIARSLRPLPSLVIALLLAWVAAVLSASWLPSALGAARSAPLLPRQIGLVIVVMAVSMVMSRTLAAGRRAASSDGVHPGQRADAQ